MKALKIVLIVVVAPVVVQLALTGINILQKGGAYKGQSMEQILGVTPGKATGKATAKDIEKLDKAALSQLFYAAPAPQCEELKGEYNAKTLSVGVLAPAAGWARLSSPLKRTRTEDTICS